MHKDVKKIIKDIKSLKVQGARNVARIAIDCLSITVKNSKTKNPRALYRELRETSDKLIASRPTEPMMRNMIEKANHYAFDRKTSAKNIVQLKKTLVTYYATMNKRTDEDAKKLAEYGARLIPQNALVLTHCHSSSVTKILIKAKKMHKKFSVVCFETRPRYQGRKTATELAKAGIDVTLSVDGGMNLYMKKADIVLVGADSITSRGDLINKIGTSTLAHIARMNDVSVYCAAELSKYSPMTIYGTREKIEERDSKEVWENPPKGVKIRNPAFEATAAKYINGYVTELGVIPCQSFFAMATQKLGIKLYE
ncbi:S-methyl-5-thioribose-1-phosphate isomerase [Candidatus Micrarchaeota archaeon]|nr:S-methyl-5-thioribose-1-phosphate isomerase [Candidatus Micrarchaeota archaeon]MBU1166763.1 S-methyl-5-thioribose-1-phosphate isomerase [Candidatus Micrarchaeota archaeon]MBU1887239.1 S-methyl-5-thioribose-1-phosphate isomerase [Candidatus Micrarchaeota archaeon]